MEEPTDPLVWHKVFETSGIAVEHFNWDNASRRLRYLRAVIDDVTVELLPRLSTKATWPGFVVAAHLMVSADNLVEVTPRKRLWIYKLPRAATSPAWLRLTTGLMGTHLFDVITEEVRELVAGRFVVVADSPTAEYIAKDTRRQWAAAWTVGRPLVI